VPVKLKGEVALTVRAELDGLGPVDGPVATWKVPDGFAQAQPPVALPLGFTPIQAPASRGGSDWTAWLELAFLLLVVALLLSRIRSKGRLR
jgi:hypothetical protein